MRILLQPVEMKYRELGNTGISASNGVSKELKESYLQMPAKASDCTYCFQCMNRCPYLVNILEKMEETVKVFE